MSATRAPAWARAGAWLVGLVCLLYVPLAGSYFLGFPSEEGAMWTRVEGALGTEGLAYGPRSLHELQRAAYTAHLGWMRLHTTCGALCLLLMLPQFLTGLRQQRPVVHRWVGRFSVGFGALAMTGAFGFLLAMPLDEIFSGKPFAIGLWAQLFLTTTGLVMGFWHIRRGQVHEHQSWMALTFGFLLTAPFLRVLWVTAARLDPAMSDAWDNNLATASILGPLSLLPALCWQAYGRPSKALARWDARGAKRRGWVLTVAAALAGAVVLQDGILRFVGVPDVEARALSLAARDADVAAFAGNPFPFVVGAIGLTVALALGARLVPAILRGESQAGSPVHLAFCVGLLAAAVGFSARAMALGSAGSLGMTTPYFYGGYAAFLALTATLALMGRASRPEASRRWTLHGFGLAFMPLLILVGAPTWRSVGLNPTEAYATAAMLAFVNPLVLVYLVGIYGYASRRAAEPAAGTDVLSGGRAVATVAS